MNNVVIFENENNGKIDCRYELQALPRNSEVIGMISLYRKEVAINDLFENEVRDFMRENIIPLLKKEVEQAQEIAQEELAEESLSFLEGFLDSER